MYKEATMKRVVSCLFILSFVLLHLSVTAAADYKIGFSAEGNKIIFPDRDSIPDADISGITFDFSGVPAEAQFMKGKVYRGQWKLLQNRGTGVIWYLFLMKWNQETLSFFVGQSSMRSTPAYHYTLTCSPQISADFSCADKKDKFSNTARLTIKDGKPVFESATGSSLYVEEVGSIPDQLLGSREKAVRTQ